MGREGASSETRYREMLPTFYTDKFFGSPEQVQMVFDAMLANPHARPLYALRRQAVLDFLVKVEERD